MLPERGTDDIMSSDLLANVASPLMAVDTSPHTVHASLPSPHMA